MANATRTSQLSTAIRLACVSACGCRDNTKLPVFVRKICWKISSIFRVFRKTSGENAEWSRRGGKMFPKNLSRTVICWLLISCSWDGAEPSPLPVKQLNKDFDLNSWIKHYDVATYDTTSLGNQHKRAKRSLGGSSSPIILQVKGLDRSFRLVLMPDENVFADGVVFESTSRPNLQFNHRITYSGFLEDRRPEISFVCLLLIDDKILIRDMFTSVKVSKLISLKIYLALLQTPLFPMTYNANGNDKQTSIKISQLSSRTSIIRHLMERGNGAGSSEGFD
ncbi:hypothetical protein GWI33_019055 [Rhynchophorus ferrugineus]|uniref:Uncharacterized protein n=1 Tax=Rhynchophorus ferrugineus TaxID=354439 RepID=A0A834HUQ8_RHYFE|nr:hypothetical protein GWI33_019055 [Rhynchophorus ferrugineus]